MHIGINALFLIPNLIGGGETYARELLRSLAELRTDQNFTVFLNNDAWASFEWVDSSPGFRRVRCNVPRAAWGRHLWEQAFLPGLCTKLGIDLLHSLGYVVPLRAKCWQAVTIHDPLFRSAPEFLPRAKRVFWNYMIPRSAEVADVVVTDSEYSRQDLIERLGLPRDKFHVAPLGPGQPLTTVTEWPELQAKYRLSKPYFLAVGTFGHKRLDVMSAAMQIVRRDKPSATLVVAGPLHTGSDEHMTNGSRSVGFVPAADLAGLYANATAFVAAAAVEGFGLPALEAMRMGTPVIVANRGSMPEIVGSAGEVVPYEDHERLASTMLEICRDDKKRSAMIAAGLERAKEFSWRRCAALTLQAYTAGCKAAGSAR